METKNTPTSYLEKIRALEGEFGDDTLAFEVASILAEETDDVVDEETDSNFVDASEIGFINIEKILEYLDNSSLEELDVRKAINSLKGYLEKQDFYISRRKLSQSNNVITWGYRLVNKCKKINKPESITTGKRRARRGIVKAEDRKSISTKITSKTKIQLGLIAIELRDDTDKIVTLGEVINKLVQDLLPGTVEEVTEQIRKLLETTDILDQTADKIIRIDKPLKTVQLIARIAHELGVSFGAVIDAIAAPLEDPPKVVIHDNGRTEYIYEEK